MNELERIVVDRCRRLGSLPFDEVVDLALYHPEHGFYASGGAAGRRGDFVTSVEVGPLFGAVVARALDSWWAEMGRPDPFVVVEAGAGAGMLARTVLAAEPECARALRYLLVERSSGLRACHGDHLEITPPELALGPTVSDADGLPVPAATGVGPIVASLGELPSLDGPVVVLANELLDNLACPVIERGPEGWLEVRVAVTGDDLLVEQLVPAGERLAKAAHALAPGSPVGGRLPVQSAAGEWLREALALASPGGRVVVFDYGADTPELVRRAPADWLRTYAGHERGGPTLERLGQQDVTTDVAFDQLARVRIPAEHRSQADWLRAHGIDDLVAEGKAVWAQRAHLGDLAALKARSRVGEAEALLDPEGLGSFHVVEWRA